MQQLTPALVYARAANRADTNDHLLSRNHFMWDDATESDADFARRPDHRPVLQRCLAWARTIPFDSDRKKPVSITNPGLLFVDQLANLGSTVAWQAAVVGAFRESGFTVEVISGGPSDTKGWFQNCVSGEYREAVFSRMDLLEDMELGKVVFNVPNTEPLDLIPTHFLRSWPKACSRAKALRDGGWSFGAIANTLAVEGYANRNERVRWYAQAAREAYEEEG